MFNIKIENFEGPLDLLLYFIKRDKIDIYDIPITQITNEYISVIDEAKKLDVSIAGEFLFMASMLLRIKTQMLLPRQINDESLDIEDPRRSIASSSSAGVLLLVPSSIRLATRLAVPFLSIASNNCPPSIRK